MAFDHSF